MRLTLDAKALLEAAKKLEGIPDGVPKLLQTTINRTLPGVRTDTVRAGRKLYTLKAKDLRDRITVKKAWFKAGKYHGAVEGRPVRVPLNLFQHRQGPLERGRRGAYRQIRARVLKSQGPKLVKGAFIATMNAAQVDAIFKRKGRARFPVRELLGPTAHSLVKKPEIKRAVRPLAEARMRKALANALNYLMKKHGL